MGKERVTITLDSETLRKVDALVSGYDLRNRSHAIESLLSKSLGVSSLRTAVIMAGGSAFPSSTQEKMLKAFIPIKNKYVIDHQIEFLKRNGISRIFVCVDKQNAAVGAYLGDGSSFGVSLFVISEKSSLGSIGGVGLLHDTLYEPFAVLNVDTLLNPSLRDMYFFHIQQKTIATMLLVTHNDTTASGAVRMRGNRILEFVEKPSANKEPSKLINGGLYIFDPQIFQFLYPLKKRTSAEFFSELARQNQLSGYTSDTSLIDIGTIQGLAHARKNWK